MNALIMVQNALSVQYSSEERRNPLILRRAGEEIEAHTRKHQYRI